MYITIYINEKPILLADHNDNRLQHKINEGYFFYDSNTHIDYKEIVTSLPSSVYKGIVILNKNLELLKSEFFSNFKKIEAGGGIVQNEKNELLFIYRNDKWDLPKGKLEKGETIELCAQREVEEETGIKNLMLQKKVGETYHIYFQNELPILKISHWYFFTTQSNQQTTAQTIEGITEVKWISKYHLQQTLSNTFINIIDILEKFTS